MLTQERLKELLSYDPETGIFTWLEANGPRAVVGERAGGIHHSGYRYIQIDNVAYGAHRLAFLYVFGYLPENEVDHRDRVRHNNKFLNLREATRQCQNRNCGMLRNNTTGVKGISYEAPTGKWTAYISVGKKTKKLGRFYDILEAAYHRFAAESCLGYPECDINSSAKQFIEKRTILDHWVAM